MTKRSFYLSCAIYLAVLFFVVLSPILATISFNRQSSEGQLLRSEGLVVSYSEKNATLTVQEQNGIHDYQLPESELQLSRRLRFRQVDDLKSWKNKHATIGFIKVHNGVLTHNVVLELSIESKKEFDRAESIRYVKRTTLWEPFAIYTLVQFIAALALYLKFSPKQRTTK